MNKLKKCPFCDGEAALKEINGRWTVHCQKNCVGTRILNDKEKVVAIWNRRVPIERNNKNDT